VAAMVPPASSIDVSKMSTVGLCVGSGCSVALSPCLFSWLGSGLLRRVARAAKQTIGVTNLCFAPAFIGYLVNKLNCKKRYPVIID